MIGQLDWYLQYNEGNSYDSAEWFGVEMVNNEELKTINPIALLSLCFIIFVN